MLVFCGMLTLDVRIDWTNSCSFTPWKGSYCKWISQLLSFTQVIGISNVYLYKLVILFSIFTSREHSILFKRIECSIVIAPLHPQFFSGELIFKKILHNYRQVLVLTTPPTSHCCTIFYIILQPTTNAIWTKIN